MSQIPRGGQYHALLGSACPEYPQEASLKVYIENDFLCLESFNFSQPQKSNRSHTGLLNIKTRLIYAYGEEVSFEYTTNANQCFMLKLGVPLAQLNETAL